MAKLTHTLSFICTVLLVACQLAIVNGLEAEQVVVGIADIQDGAIEARQDTITAFQSNTFSTITSSTISTTSSKLNISITSSPPTQSTPKTTISNSPPASSVPGNVGNTPHGGTPLGKTNKIFSTYAHGY